MRQILWLIYICYFCSIITTICSEDTAKSKIRAEKLPICQACKTLVNSFKRGIEKTSRGKFEGGDAAWEEKNQGSYANSEVRLVEIQEDLCKDVERGHIQCHSLVEVNEEALETWWFQKQKEDVDLFQYLCIDIMKACCPNNTFGADCTPCPGGIENPCSGHGKCRGAGTRKGSGDCKCNTGYSGILCDDCALGYYPALENDKSVCLECHKSCQGHCWGVGPGACEVCKEGWVHNPEYGCQDIDECYSGSSSCSSNEFCVNVEGSYQCIECHKSCNGCHGDGPDMCFKCADDYVLKDGICVGSETWRRTFYTQVTRYITYLGMCIAICIIFRKNVTIGAFAGVAVAIYIAASEYTVSDSDVDIFPKFAGTS